MKNLSYIMIIILLSGCVTGPFFKDSYNQPPVDLKGKKIIVSKFLKAERKVSTTQSYDIKTILESAYVQDISFDIAQHLKEQGCNAEAVYNFDAKNLKDNEVFLNGAIILGGKEDWPAFVSILIVVPWILPVPWAYTPGHECKYRYEIIDKNGQILVHTSDEYLTGYMKCHHLLFNNFIKLRREAEAGISKKISEKIAANFK